MFSMLMYLHRQLDKWTGKLNDCVIQHNQVDELKKFLLTLKPSNVGTPVNKFVSKLVPLFLNICRNTVFLLNWHKQSHPAAYNLLSETCKEHDLFLASLAKLL